MIKFSIIICTYNRSELLNKCLFSIERQSEKDDYEVIIIDNNSTDNTYDIVKKYNLPEKKYCVEYNQGLSYARNRGFKEGSGKYITYIDDDAVLCPNYCKYLKNIINNVNPEPAAIGGIIIPDYETKPPYWFNDSFEIRTWGDKERFVLNKSFSGFSGSNMTIKKELLEQVNGFDVSLGMNGKKISLGEETLLFKEISKINNTFYFDPELVVEHWTPVRNFKIRYRVMRSFKSGISQYHIKKMDNQKIVVLLWATLGLFKPLLNIFKNIKKNNYKVSSLFFSFIFETFSRIGSFISIFYLKVK